MTRTTTTLALAASLLATACYGSAPSRPPVIPLPPESGAEITVRTHSETNIEDVQKKDYACPEGAVPGAPSCIVSYHTEREPVTHTETTATYEGSQLSYAQFAVMTDPAYDKKLATLDDLRHKCTRANIPRYAGIGLMVGGLVVGSLVPSGGKAIAYTGLIAGAGSFTYGYLFAGGRACVEAGQLRASMDFSRHTKDTTMYGEDYAKTMRELADRYNLSRGSRSQASR